MTSQHAIRLRAWVIHLTVASLLLAQSLGFLHRTVHAQVASGAVAATASRYSCGPFDGSRTWAEMPRLLEL